jgi:serine/threonine protein phosphatase PrpC
MKVEFAATTNNGRVRDHNEDNFMLCSDLHKNEWSGGEHVDNIAETSAAVMIVADGMGGANAGEVASEIAVNEIKKYLQSRLNESDRKRLLTTSILSAHEAIRDHQSNHLSTQGMGTTAIVAEIADDSLYVAWSGDSRCYVIRRDLEPSPLTDDHSYVWDLVQQNLITAEQARTHPQSNVITQCLGLDQLPNPGYLQFDLRQGDVVILCTDGLNGIIPDEEIKAIALRNGSSRQIVDELILTANNNGGRDNITVVVGKILSVEQEIIGPNITTPRKVRLFAIAAIALLLVASLFAVWWKPLSTPASSIVPKPDSVVAPITRQPLELIDDSIDHRLDTVAGKLQTGASPDKK